MNYQNKEIAKEYLKFINSEDGQIQQEAIFEAIKNALLPGSKKILDAACGNGWLSKKLAQMDYEVEGCDISPLLLSEAKKSTPSINFQLADLNTALPYPENYFYAVIFNMAAHDVSNLQNAFNEITRVVKQEGQVIVTIANPYYSMPVGVWKRGILGILLKLKPKLKLSSYFSKKNQSDRSFVWKKGIVSYFYTLPEYFKAAKNAGLNLENFDELESKTDSKNFSVRYRMFRFPITLILSFKKTPK